MHIGKSNNIQVVWDEKFPDHPKEAIRSAFEKAEKYFLEIAEKESKDSGDFHKLDKSGSCATVLMIVDSMCYVVNVGDSWALMSSEGGNKIYALSRDHWPDDEYEEKWITEAGGKIYQTKTLTKIATLGGYGMKS